MMITPLPLPPACGRLACDFRLPLFGDFGEGCSAALPAPLFGRRAPWRNGVQHPARIEQPGSTATVAPEPEHEHTEPHDDDLSTASSPPEGDHQLSHDEIGAA